MPGQRGTNDGVGSAARFADPHGITVDASGNVYVTEIGAYSVRRITPDGKVTTVARLGPLSPGWNPFGGGPWGVAVDAAANVYLADTPRHTIVKIAPDGTTNVVAGLPGAAGYLDGTNGAARFDTSADVALDYSGNIYVADWYRSKIRRVTRDGVVSTVVGPSGSGYNKDARWTKAYLNRPVSVGLDSTGNLFIADENNNTIRKLSSRGMVSTLARSIFGPHGAAVDTAGNVYVADMNGGVVKRVTPEGLVTTLAGNRALYSTVEGAGNAAGFNSLRGTAVDSLGNVYVTDVQQQVVRKGVPFAVTTLPQSQTVVAGTNATFTVAANGSNGPFSYQWFFESAPLPGQTNTMLELTSVSRSNGGGYSVTVSNAVGNWVKFSATLRVLVPQILSSPEVFADGTVRLLFQDGDGGLPADLAKVTVQWRTNLPSGTDTSWQTMTSNFYFTNGYVALDDTNTVSSPSRFYRVLQK
jgi:sugar lactone lactonase YvrE